MSYRLRPDESPAAGIRRIVREQLSKAVREMERPAGKNEGAAIHATRKRIKKTRAVLRLVGRELGPVIFEEENGRLRDIGRALSQARDAQVQWTVLEKLRQETGQKRGAFGKTAALLKREVAELSTDLAAEKGAAVTTLQQIGDRLEGWPLEQLRMETLACALHDSYRRARKKFQGVKDDPAAEKFHSWRKRVKDVWYQALLLQNLNPAVLCPLADTAKTLGQRLGELHDLHFFQARLEKDQLGAASERTVLLGLLCAQQGRAEEVVLALGGRFFAEKPRALEKRLLRYAEEWTTSRAGSP